MLVVRDTREHVRIEAGGATKAASTLSVMPQLMPSFRLFTRPACEAANRLRLRKVLQGRLSIGSMQGVGHPRRLPILGWASEEAFTARMEPAPSRLLVHPFHYAG